MSYVPPRDEDVATEAAPATENHRVPLLVREEDKSDEHRRSPIPPAALQGGRTELGIPVVDLPDAPDVLAMWKGQKNWMRAWLATSIVALLFFGRLFTVWVFYPSTLACIFAIIASSAYICNCWNVPLPRQVKITVSFGVIAAVMDSWNAILTFMVLFAVDCGDNAIADCRAFEAVFVIFGLYLVWHAWLSAHISSKARDALRMLNPVSSGMVSVNRV